MKLNIGCGRDIREGFVNIDFNKGDSVDLVIDLNKERLIDYFKFETIEFIYMSHILEHIINPYEVIMDCYYILKKNGSIEVRLPTTLRSSLGHLRNGHTTSYFYCVSDKPKNKIGLDTKNLFNVTVYKNRKHYKKKEWIYMRFVNFRDWLYRQIYDEYIYNLVKK